jgi:hypothetical protein
MTPPTNEEKLLDRELRLSKAETELESLLEWDKWIKEVPFISFPKKWEVQIIPPYGRKIVRFHVKLKEFHDNPHHISVFLEVHDSFYGREPYWEIYPNKEGDCSRIPMNNITKLLRELKEALKYLYED